MTVPANPGSAPQAFPADMQIISPQTGLLTPGWKYFLLNMWNRFTLPASPQAQTIGSSPFTFTAYTNGTFTATSGTFKLSRNGSTATQINKTDTGGSVYLLTGDVLTLSWGTAPTVNWWPGG